MDARRFGPRLAGRFRSEFANGLAFAIDRIGDDGEYTSLLVRFIAPTPITRGEAARRARGRVLPPWLD